MEHVPVLLKEVLEILAPSPGDRILDATLGLGGHAGELLQCAGDGGFLVGIDTDRENIARAEAHLPVKNVLLIHSNFRNIPDCFPPEHRQFDVILADLGLSSPHLDDPARGFSFRHDAPLDMRLDRSSGEPASMLLASRDRLSLIAAFRDFGELERAHRLVDEIILRRKTDPVRTTSALESVVLKAYGNSGRDLLPQIFQALRIAVNGELASLEALLAEAPKLLADGGRFAVISFHSLEDRMVKTRFKEVTTPAKDPVTGSESAAAGFELLTKRPITPSDQEVAENPRARSARLRAIRKTGAYTLSRP